MFSFSILRIGVCSILVLMVEWALKPRKSAAKLEKMAERIALLKRIVQAVEEAGLTGQEKMWLLQQFQSKEETRFNGYSKQSNFEVAY